MLAGGPLGRGWGSWRARSYGVPPPLGKEGHNKPNMHPKNVLPNKSTKTSKHGQVRKHPGKRKMVNASMRPREEEAKGNTVRDTRHKISEMGIPICFPLTVVLEVLGNVLEEATSNVKISTRPMGMVLTTRAQAIPRAQKGPRAKDNPAQNPIILAEVHQCTRFEVLMNILSECCCRIFGSY